MDVPPIEAQKQLIGAAYPASRGDLIEHARCNGANDAVLNVLRRLPDRSYDAPAAVRAALCRHRVKWS